MIDRERTILDVKSSNVFISEMEKAEKRKKHKIIFDVDINMKEGIESLDRILKHRRKIKC